MGRLVPRRHAAGGGGRAPTSWPAWADESLKPSPRRTRSRRPPLVVLQQKFRQAGHQTLCLPYLKWLHRFGRPRGVPYRLQRLDKLRNYLLGWTELGLDIAPIRQHFLESGLVSRADWDSVLDNVENDGDWPPLQKVVRSIGGHVFQADAGCGDSQSAGTLAEQYERARSTPSDINEHCETLRRLASECEHATEFGMRHGVSTVALLAGSLDGGSRRSSATKPADVRHPQRGGARTRRIRVPGGQLTDGRDRRDGPAVHRYEAHGRPAVWRVLAHTIHQVDHRRRWLCRRGDQFLAFEARVEQRLQFFWRSCSGPTDWARRPPERPAAWASCRCFDETAGPFTRDLEAAKRRFPYGPTALGERESAPRRPGGWFGPPPRSETVSMSAWNPLLWSSRLPGRRPTPGVRPGRPARRSSRIGSMFTSPTMRVPSGRSITVSCQGGHSAQQSRRDACSSRARLVLFHRNSDSPIQHKSNGAHCARREEQSSTDVARPSRNDAICPTCDLPPKFGAGRFWMSCGVGRRPIIGGAL